MNEEEIRFIELLRQHPELEEEIEEILTQARVCVPA